MISSTSAIFFRTKIAPNPFFGHHRILFRQLLTTEAGSFKGQATLFELFFGLLDHLFDFEGNETFWNLKLMGIKQFLHNLVGQSTFGTFFALLGKPLFY